MYRPPPFSSDDPGLLRDLIQSSPFATMISVDTNVPVVTHLPFVLDGDHILGHLARANPHSRLLDRDVMVSFLGPHAFVSARWYRRPDEQVPTWNYVAATVRGRPERVDAADAVRRMGGILDPAWSAGPVVDALAPAIVAFRLPLVDVELKVKLSQNRDVPDSDRVHGALDGGCEAERSVAAWMRRVRAAAPARG